MNKWFKTEDRHEIGIEGPSVIHADGVFIIGSATLCGHTDRTDGEFIESTKKVTCHACIAVIKHVHDNYPKRSYKHD